MKKYESDEGVSWNHFVEVQPGFHEPRYWFDIERSQNLEWIVTLIGNQLESKKCLKTHTNPQTLHRRGMTVHHRSQHLGFAR